MHSNKLSDVVNAGTRERTLRSGSPHNLTAEEEHGGPLLKQNGRRGNGFTEQEA